MFLRMIVTALLMFCVAIPIDGYADTIEIGDYGDGNVVRLEYVQELGGPF